MKSLDSLAGDMEREGAFRNMDALQERAYNLILGDAKKAFDLSQETTALREKYGRNHFGQSCLLARRLVENNVPFVTVDMGGWDTHTDNFGAMKKLLPVLDAGFASLLEDLAERSLLESTIVVWFGEFGRTPRFSWNHPGSAGVIIMGMYSRPWWLAADFRAARWWAPRTFAGKPSRSGRSIPGTCRPACTSCSASIPWASFLIRKAA